MSEVDFGQFYANSRDARRYWWAFCDRDSAASGVEAYNAQGDRIAEVVALGQ